MSIEYATHGTVITVRPSQARLSAYAAVMMPLFTAVPRYAAVPRVTCK